MGSSSSGKGNEPRKGGDRKGFGNTSGSGANKQQQQPTQQQNNQQQQHNSGKKRWQQSRSNAGGGGYESDASSSARSNGPMDLNKCNYGLLQNMKLWNTQANYKGDQLLTGELGPQQLMSPTNHRCVPPPILITVLEAQQDNSTTSGGGGDCTSSGSGGGGGGVACELASTQPVIQQDEPDTESAYWSSIFPYTGTLDDGVDGLEESTPADKYLANAHLMELVETPKELLVECPVGNSLVDRDTLSQQVWKTFLTVQQTQVTYKKKLVIWKVLYASIKVRTIIIDEA